MLTDRKLTFIDLFSGCGGFSEGLLQTKKFNALAHVEWELAMVDTLRNRLVEKWGDSEEIAKKKVIHFDIQKTKELIDGKWKQESIDKYGKTNHSLVLKKGLKGVVGKKKVDIIIGGPPCQAYSIAGRAQDKNSMKNDYRNFLFESFIGVVKEFRPEIFVFENVPGLLSAKPGGESVTSRMYTAFDRIGYSIRSSVEQKKSIYTATDFGVPQLRKRIIIFGVKKNSNIELEDLYKAFDSYRSTHFKLTVRDIIGNLPPFLPFNVSKKVNGQNISHYSVKSNRHKHHIPRYHNIRDIDIFKKWLSDDMNKKSSVEKISFYNRHLKKKSNHAKYRNLEWDKPSPTIVAHLSKDGLMFIHPDPNQARSITIYEAALIQSFPNNYKFIGTNANCYKMIGNAVPPMMAKCIGLALLKNF
jgi:DNA (cytosine-5)-methyltransferase 1